MITPNYTVVKYDTETETQIFGHAAKVWDMQAISAAWYA